LTFYCYLIILETNRFFKFPPAFRQLIYNTREPMRARAESRDHVIVRARKERKKEKCPKAVLTHLQNRVVWTRALKCSVKPYVTGPSTECYFIEFMFVQIYYTWYIRINQRLWAFGVAWSPILITIVVENMVKKNRSRFPIVVLLTTLICSH
jgi:hypothetical protein